MKRKFFPAFLALCLILTMLPMSALAEELPKVAPEASEASNEAQVAAAVAEIGTTEYDTLAAAVTAAGTETSATIKLLKSTTEDITIPEKADITLEIPESMTLTNKSGDTISNKGTLTITGAGTVDNTIHAKGALVNYPSGIVTLKGGITLTRSLEKYGKSWYVIKNMGTVTIENAKVFVDKENGGSSSLIDNGWYDAADKNGNGNDRNTARPDNAFATLTITGGTLSGGMNTVKNDDCGILKITGGSFSNASGPNVLNWNETTINGGTFSGISSTGLIANGYNNNGFNAGMITITDGKFTVSGNGTGFLFGTGNGSKKGGKFLIGGGTFTGGLTQVGVQLDYTFEITGGTFSADPKDYVTDGFVGVKNTDNKFEIKSYEDAFAPTFNLSKAGGVKADKLTLSGTVDPRTYTVTDPKVQSLFGTLLTEQKPADSVALRSESTAPVMYVKDNKHLSFGIIKFANLADDGNYIIQQTNPALNYAYGKDAFPGGFKIETYTGEKLKDGLYFMISDQPGDIIFKIAPSPAPSVAAADTDTEATLKLPEKVATYTITNSVKFAASAAPAVTTVEIPATVTTSESGEITAKAEPSTEVVKTAVTSAAGGTVTIETKASDTNVNAVEVALTNDVVAALATSEKANVKEVVLETPVGTVTLSDDALKTIAGSSNNKGATVNVKQANVSTTIANAVAAFEVDVKSNSTAVEITNLTTPIKLSFNIGAGLKNPVLMYLDNNTLKPIKSSSYNVATGIITGETTHLSTFAVVNSMGVETGGVGCEVTLTAANQNDYLTIQVTNGNANSIYTVKVIDSEKKVVLYVKSGTVLNVWETSVVPTFESGEFKPKEESTILVNNQTVTAS